MAGSSYTSKSIPLGTKSFSAGVNTASGPLGLQDNESSDLSNVDFNKFGSVLKRNGYLHTNATSLGAYASDGLYWYEHFASGSLVQQVINVVNGTLNESSDNGATFSAITGSLTITPDYHYDFDTWLNRVYGTNGKDTPWYYTGTGNGTVLTALRANSYTFIVTGVTTAPLVGATYTNNGITYTVVTSYISSGSGTIVATGSGSSETAGNLTKTGGTGDASIAFSAFTINANIQNAKYVKQFSNYLFLANCTVGGVYYPTRIYYSALKDDTQWSAANYLEVSKDDGQEITGIRVLSDRLVVYKTRSIYTVFYTGDIDIPFILPGGGKANSPVGCIAPFSIQEVDNGHVFLAYDGLYFFDSSNSYKLSYRLDNTFSALNLSVIENCRSLVQKVKNRYWLAVSNGSSNTNNFVIVWDFYNNAFSFYSGINASAMCELYITSSEERPHFADYAGYVYRADFGTDDYPSKVQTAIDSYYYTNWKTFDDLVDQKGVPSVFIYHQQNSGTLSFSYSFEFADGDQYTSVFTTSESASLWDVAVWDVALWGATGGAIKRRDLTGRGRVVRFKFANNNMSETYRIDGFGAWTHLETHT
jgi:hypothetical protein